MRVFIVGPFLSTPSDGYDVLGSEQTALVGAVPIDDSPVLVCALTGYDAAARRQIALLLAKDPFRRVGLIEFASPLALSIAAGWVASLHDSAAAVRALHSLVTSMSTWVWTKRIGRLHVPSARFAQVVGSWFDRSGFVAQQSVGGTLRAVKNLAEGALFDAGTRLIAAEGLPEDVARALSEHSGASIEPTTRRCSDAASRYGTSACVELLALPAQFDPAANTETWLCRGCDEPSVGDLCIFCNARRPVGATSVHDVDVLARGGVV